MILTPLLSMSQLLSEVYRLGHRGADSLDCGGSLEVSRLLARFHLKDYIADIEH